MRSWKRNLKVKRLNELKPATAHSVRLRAARFAPGMIS